MPKQKSIVKFKGTMDDMTFYKKKGKYYVRKKGGNDRERILNDPNFARVRENMSEFSAAAKVAAKFRKSIGTLVKQLGGTTVQARLTRIFRKMINSGAGKSGQRDIQLLPNKLLFSEFQFNEDKNFGSVFTAMVDPPTIDANRSVVSWEVPVFDLENELIMPSGTTHYRFVLATTVLSDHMFNEGSGTYVPTTDAAFVKRDVAYSEYLEATEPLAAAIPLSTDLGLAEALPDTAISLTVVGVLFYKEVNGTYLSLKSEQALELILAA
tara:strand:+ start:760 stop:1560 length:801 start_codon:yes stop_codon:yes gene_type:complete